MGWGWAKTGGTRAVLGTGQARGWGAQNEDTDRGAFCPQVRISPAPGQHAEAGHVLQNFVEYFRVTEGQHGKALESSHPLPM